MPPSANASCFATINPAHNRDRSGTRRRQTGPVARTGFWWLPSIRRRLTLTK
jgi:hypothetical protein